VQHKRFFSELVFQSVVAMTVAVALAIVAVVLRIWTWPNAIVGGVLLACGVFYLTDRLGVLSPSARTRVRDWLDESSYSVQTLNDENIIHFVIIDNLRLSTHIMQVKHGDPLIIFMPQMVASDDQLAVFKALTEEQKKSVWKAVRLELLRLRIQFTDLDINGVSVTSQIGMSRSLTGVEFMREVMNVRAGGRLYLELINSHIPEIAGSKTASKLPNGG
jgi:hypothetical protein